MEEKKSTFIGSVSSGQIQAGIVSTDFGNVYAISKQYLKDGEYRKTNFYYPNDIFSLLEVIHKLIENEKLTDTRVTGAKYYKRGDEENVSKK